MVHTMALNRCSSCETELIEIDWYGERLIGGVVRCAMPVGTHPGSFTRRHSDSWTIYSRLTRTKARRAIELDEGHRYSCRVQYGTSGTITSTDSDEPQSRFFLATRRATASTWRPRKRRAGD